MGEHKRNPNITALPGGKEPPKPLHTGKMGPASVARWNAIQKTRQQADAEENALAALLAEGAGYIGAYVVGWDVTDPKNPQFVIYEKPPEGQPAA